MIRTFASAAFLAHTFAQQELLVDTTLGKIQGHYNELGQREWNGIPYAQPPEGELRWEQALPAKPFADTYTGLCLIENLFIIQVC
jgi:hypothetical protein